MHHQEQLLSSTQSKYAKFKSRLEKNITNGTFEKLPRGKKNRLLARVEKFKSRLENLNLSVRGVAVAGTFTAGAMIPGMVSGQGQGVFLEKTGSSIPFPSNVVDLKVANVDTDPDLEIIVSSSAGGQILNGNLSDGFTLSSLPDLSDMTRDFVVGDIDGDTHLDVVFFDNTDGSYFYKSINDGDGNFTTNASYYETSRVTEFDLVDWDSDGDLDIVVASNSDFFEVLDNDGSGNFTDLGNFNLGTYQVRSVEFADMDNDGDMDLLYVGYNGTYPYRGGVYLLENTTDAPGTPTLDFGNPDEVRVLGYFRADGIEVLDMDGDGDLDVFFHRQSSSYGFASSNQHVEGSTLTFNDVNVSYLAGSSAGAISDAAVADFDDDGDDDIIVVNQGYFSEILSFDGTTLDGGSGSLLSEVGDAAGNFSEIALGDFDGDGHLDLVGTNSLTNYVYLDVSGVQKLAFSNGDFSERKTTAGSIFGRLIAFDRNDTDIGDTDGGTAFMLATGDGSNDADNSRFSITGSGSTAQLLIGASDLDFETQSEYRILISTVASGVTRDFELVLHLQNSPEEGFGSFEANATPVTSARAVSPVLADLDGDGDDELLYKENIGNSFIFLDTDLTDNAAVSIAYGDQLIVTDFDNDGDLDLITNIGTDVYISLNDGSGGFSDTYGYRLGSFGSTVHDIAVADFDNDGDTDIVLGKSSGGEVWFNNGDRTFSLQTNVSSYASYMVEVGDMDEDGWVDIVFGSSYDGSYYTNVYSNNGDGSFSQANSYFFSEIRDLKVSDFDGDGNLDILVASSENMAVFNGDGAGSFSQTDSSVPYVIDSSDIVFGDIDADDDLDILYASGYDSRSGSSGGEKVRVLLNDGTNSFENSQDFPVSESDYDSFRGLALGDVDGDDDLDVVVSGGENRQVFDNENIAPYITSFTGKVIIDENTPNGSPLGQLEVTDLNGDAISTIAFSDGANDNGLFLLDVDGNLTLNTDLDWEELGSTLSIEVEVGDDQGNSRVENVELKINNLPEEGNGTFNDVGVPLFGSQEATAFEPGDYDMDGDADLFKSTNVGGGGQSISIDKGGQEFGGDTGYGNSMFQQNSGSFSDEPIRSLSNDSYLMVFLDHDNDGDLDILSHSGGYMQISTNDEGDFNQSQDIIENSSANFDDVDQMIVGDFDRDGLLEVAVRYQDSGDYDYYGVRVFEIEDGQFSERQDLLMYDGSDIPSSLVSGDFESMQIGDFTGNGFDDLIAVTGNDDDILFEGSAAGFSTTGTPVITQADYGLGASFSGDINGDGDPDLIIGRNVLADDQKVLDIYLNDGSGTFSLNQTISNANQFFVDLQLGDIDGDGTLDMISSSYQDNGSVYGYNLEIRTNDGTGTFTLSQTITDASAERLRLMDVDGDDDLDIVGKRDADGDNRLVAFFNDNVAPTAINLSATAFDEHLALDTEVATITIDDLNPGDTHVISLVTGDGSNDLHNSFFSLNGTSLRVTKDVSFEETPQLNILLSVYDGHQTFEQAYVLDVNDVNVAPTGINLSVTAFDEGTMPGSQIATISAVDVNVGDNHVFEFAVGDGSNDADNGAFIIDGDRLIITETSNFETKASYFIYLSATDIDNTFEQAFEITVNDVNQLPTSIALSSTSFDEGIAIGSEIATLSAIDANISDTHTFAFATGDGTNDADNGSFVIDGDKLLITVNSRFEDQATYNIYLSASDADGSVEEAITLNVNDINQAPTGMALSTTSFDEGTAPGSSVATISAIDANAGDIHTFEFAVGDGSNDADNASFTINGNQLVIVGSSSFETQPSYNIFLRATDTEGSADQAFVVTVNDLNQAPTGVALSTTSFDEGTNPGSSVATISAIDANAGDTHTFEFAVGDGTNDADNASFIINGDQLVIVDESSFETQPTYNIYLRATDTEGSAEQAFVMTVNDLNQAPTGVALSTTSFDEGTAPGTSIATISAIDANAGDTHTFALVAGDGTNDVDNGSFVINGDQLLIVGESNFDVQDTYKPEPDLKSG